MSDTVNLSGMAPGYRYATKELAEAISAVSITYENAVRQKFSEGGILKKIWKLIKTLWASKTDIVQGVDGFKEIPKEVFDLNAAELTVFTDHLWSKFADQLSAKNRFLFGEALDFMIVETARLRRIQNHLKPPRAEVLPE